MEKNKRQWVKPFRSLYRHTRLWHSGLITLLLLWVALPLQAQSWWQVTGTNNSDGRVQDNFGQAVAVSGDYAIIASNGQDYDVANANYVDRTGAAYFFERTATGWTQVKKVTQPSGDRHSGDVFGTSVAISGNYAIVGAPGEDHHANGGQSRNNAGAAYIFERVAGVWTYKQKITSSGRIVGGQFGNSVGISGDYVIVGATHEERDASELNPLSQSGAAYIYERNGSGTWVQVKKIVPSDRKASVQFGRTATISGNYAAVGSVAENTDAAGANSKSSAGAVYMLERDGSGNWAQVQKVVPSDRTASDQFGCSISLSGSRILIGAQYQDLDAAGANSLSDAGAAYIFDLVGGTWTQTQKIVSGNRESSGIFGVSVSLSGDKIVVGASQEDTDVNNANTLGSAGAAYIFELDGSTWTRIQKIVASDRTASYFYGSSIAITDDHVVSGSWRHSADYGRAYFYDGPWTFTHGGFALGFDGIDDYVSFTGPDLTATDFTVEGWVRKDADGSVQSIFSEGSVNAAGESFTVSFNAANNLEVGFVDVAYASSSAYSDGLWHHVAVSFAHGTSALKAYVDGVLVIDQTSTSTVSGNTVARLGTASFTSGQYLSGQLDEFRIWSEVRSQAQIQANMNRELVGDETELVAYYYMYDSTGTSLSDNSVNNNTGTLTNGPTWKASGALAGPRQALDFDGTNDYVVGDFDALATGTLTMEGWFSFNDLANLQNLLYIHTTADPNIRIAPYKTDANNINLWLSDGSNEYDISSSFVISQTNEWHHFAFIYDQGVVSILVDGQLAGTATGQGSFSTGATNVIVVGADYTSSNPNQFSNVKIDEVRIWSSARTEAEIRANMYHTLRGDEDSLKAYYRFDQKPDAGNLTLFDITANANHGTLTNMTPATDWVNSNPFNTWIGSEDSDWSNVDNWSLGSLPSTQDAGIFGWPGSELPASGNISARNFYLDAATTFTHSGDLILSGDFFNAGTFTSTGTTTFNGSSSQTIRGTGTTTFGTLLLNKGGVVALDHNVATSDLTLTSGDLSIGTNTLTVHGAIAQTAGTLTGGSTSSLVVAGSGASTALPGITLSGLTLNRANGLALSGTVNVEGSLTLTDGVLDLNSQVLDLGEGATISGTPANSRHVDATSGTLRKGYSGAGSFVFPVGDGSLYSPITLNFTSGGFSSAYADINLYASKHPNNGSSTDYISR